MYRKRRRTAASDLTVGMGSDSAANSLYLFLIGNDKLCGLASRTTADVDYKLLLLLA